MLSTLSSRRGPALTSPSLNVNNTATMANQRVAWASLSPMLVFSCFCLLVGDMLFGFDTGSFGGILANPGFINQFGTYNPQTESYAFTSSQTSIMSSIPFIGKFVGCLVAGSAIERYGHRIVFVLLSIISFAGVILEITAADAGSGTGRFSQFLIGRVVVYVSVGLVEVDVTTYQAEIVPAPFRGLVVISLQLFLTAGALVASGVNKAYSTYTNGVGWKTVTGLQFIFPALLIVFVYFIPDSPRWLLSKDRETEATECLCRLRSKADADEGRCDDEITAIKQALREHVHKGPWVDLVRGNNLRQTAIVMVYYFFQQATGQAFASTYQTVFYKENGYADKAFTYPIINSVLGCLAVIPAMYLVDNLGRRYTLMISYALQALWLFVLAGVGSMTSKTTTERNTVVAAFMLFTLCYNMGSASIPYLLGGEIPNAALREKTQSLGTSWNVIWAFVTNYIIPYMLSGLHFGVGWVFGGISAFAFVFTFFFLPETKGRALEEIDAIFATSFNPFRPQNIPFSDAERRSGGLDGDKDLAGSIHNGKPGLLSLGFSGVQQQRYEPPPVVLVRGAKRAGSGNTSKQKTKALEKTQCNGLQCLQRKKDCVRSYQRVESESPRGQHDISPMASSSSGFPQTKSSTAARELPGAEELRELVQLYFSSVHYFGYFEFIHQFHFDRLLAKDRAPRELTLLMIASAVRFAAAPTPENLARADAWADAAIEALVPRIHNGFGAIQLMSLLLAQHYDLNRGNFTSAWMMQMMSLHTFDRTFPRHLTSQMRLSPLLTSEALRRTAWATFYLDSITDGGRYGFHVVDEKTFRLQLPCEQSRFLSNEVGVTEPLFPDSAESLKDASDNFQGAPLDMSAYLLRTGAARRRALHFAFRASHKEDTVEQLCTELGSLEADFRELVADLPGRFLFNSNTAALHRERLTTFILLHILRHNLFIILGRAALSIYQRGPDTTQLIPQVRRDRILHALPIAGLIAEGLKADINFDPHIGVHAYVALEILLFEPRRLAQADLSVDPKSAELTEALSHLLAVLRDLAKRSEFVRQLVCIPTLIIEWAATDAPASQDQLVGQDAAEYDFRDFRWAKVERLQRGASSTTDMARDEALLEYREGRETTVPSIAPSPRLDAIYTSNSLDKPPVDALLHSVPSGSSDLNDINANDENDLGQDEQLWWGLNENEFINQGLSLNTLWLLGSE
ncbi:hypothetical protein F66182_1103 [Fusarium sp. NRRL 66182]|nr:hypothetical protein F66182_1103 [Fusarium sp. NRRL 66182]